MGVVSGGGSIPFLYKNKKRKNKKMSDIMWGGGVSSSSSSSSNDYSAKGTITFESKNQKIKKLKSPVLSKKQTDAFLGIISDLYEDSDLVQASLDFHSDELKETYPEKYAEIALEKTLILLFDYAHAQSVKGTAQKPLEETMAQALINRGMTKEDSPDLSKGEREFLTMAGLVQQLYRYVAFETPDGQMNIERSIKIGEHVQKQGTSSLATYFENHADLAQQYIANKNDVTEKKNDDLIDIQAKAKKDFTKALNLVLKLG